MIHSSSDNTPRASRSRFRQVASIALAIILLAIVVASISFDDLIDAIQNIDVRLLIPAYLLNLVMISLMALRWQLLYRVYDTTQRPSYRQILSATFIAVFFNNFLPSTIGGDVYRTIHMSRTHKQEGVPRSLSVVYVDRVMGLLGLGVVGLISLIFSVNQIELPSAVVYWIGLLFTGLTIGLVFSLNPRFHNLILGLITRVLGKWGQRLQGQAQLVFAQLVVYADQRFLLMQALGLSIVLRVVWIFGCYLVGLSLDINVSFVALLVAIPLIELIRMIPITLQGIGVREGLFVLFFGYYGVSASDATVLAMLIYLLLNLNGIVGGLLFLANQRHHREQQSAEYESTPAI